MTENEMISAIQNARSAAGLSQDALADATGISQATLSRILNGERIAKLPEIILIAEATACTVAQLTGSAVAERMECAARAANGSSTVPMRQQLLHFMELDAYLDDQAIPAR
ncbi:MAG: helix-turn-helix domain-containing protein [Ancrocorticia sp.]|uniref:helix-turn-helix domain-containing protein n=1 Tax=Ancrocorticia sp. TaxID=2593684 RepID=UPI003F932101